MPNLSGLIALITGARGGIGTATCEAFAAAGARLALVDIAECSDLASRFGGEHRSYPIDLIDADAIAATVANRTGLRHRHPDQQRRPRHGRACRGAVRHRLGSHARDQLRPQG